MKAYVLEGIGQLEWKEVKLPALSKGEALVQVMAAGICGSDIPRIFETGTYHFPTIPGHEFAGRVVDGYGEEAKRWIGKRVGIFPLIPCGGCSECQKKRYEMCGNYNYLGSRCDGGFAEYVAVPIWNLIALPEAVGIEEAAMLEPASVALHGVRNLRLEKKYSVALFGLGTIGCIIAQWLSFYGIEEVWAVGHRQEFGEVMKKTAKSCYEYSNTELIDEIHWIKDSVGKQGVDIAVDCLGTSDSIKNCLEVVKPGGQILIVGNPKNNIEISKDNYWKILRKQITVKGTWNSSFRHEDEDDWHMVLIACCEKRIKLSDLITHKLPFDKLQEGLEVMRKKDEYRNKIMILQGLSK